MMRGPNFADDFLAFTYTKYGKEQTFTIDDTPTMHFMVEKVHMMRLQLNDKGSKELLIHWEMPLPASVWELYDEGGYTKNYAIWDLDEGKEIFRATSDYLWTTSMMMEDGKEIYEDSAWYHYDIQLKGDGRIEISNLETRCVRHDFFWSIVNGTWESKRKITRKGCGETGGS